MNLLETIRRTLRDQNLLRTGDVLVVGVSGGADSMALLELLDRLRPEFGLTLIVGHVNHGLRDDADADQTLVEQFCRNKGLRFYASRVSIPGPRRDLEQTARTKRLAALGRTVRRFRADALVLAHHQDDLAETVLMRLLRGTGLQGLQAILPKRTIDGITVIRPLLNVTRAHILDFLHTHRIPFREDPSNTDPKFLRNSIRHRLLPELAKDYNPNISQVLARLADTAALDYDFLNQTAARHLQQIILTHTRYSLCLNRVKLRRRHPALQRMILRLALTHIAGSTRRLTLEHAHALETLITLPVTPNDRPTPRLHLPGGLSADVTATELILRQGRG